MATSGRTGPPDRPGDPGPGRATAESTSSVPGGAGGARTAPRGDPAGVPGPVGTKEGIRRAVLARRRSRTADERAVLARRLRDVLLTTELLPRSGGVVACYASRGSEPGTPPLVASLVARGTEVLLPHTHDGSDGGGVRLGWGRAHLRLPEPGDDAPDDVVHRGPAAGLAGRGVAPAGGAGPALAVGPDLGDDALRRAAVVLVPALAVDTAGRRLGRGGGYYDRALSGLREHRGWLPPVVAVVHDDEVLDVGVEPVPAEPHDVRVSHVVTPARWMRVDNP